MAGFGKEPFGNHPFGRSNFGADTVVRVFPRSTLERDKEQGDLLRRYLLTIQNSINSRKVEIDSMITLIDPDRVRADILDKLGSMIGIDLDENEGEEFQRTLVRDAVQYYQVKGSNKSFEIRGKISGFDVEVVKIWHVDEMYLPLIPLQNRFEFPPGSGTVSGIWYTDLSPDQVPGVSGLVPINGGCDYCLTSYIKINYTLIKLPTGPIIGNLLDRVVQKIRDVIPIHIRDIFVDLTVRLRAGFNSNINSTTSIETNLRGSVVDRYDMIPADFRETDYHTLNTFGMIPETEIIINRGSFVDRYDIIDADIIKTDKHTLNTFGAVP